MQHKLMQAYVMQLLHRYRRLLVLRVDFSYQAEHSASVSEVQARADLRRLFANRRCNAGLLPDMVGYVCRMEWAFDTKYHFHVMFFLDGDLRRKDAHIAQQIGRYWVDVITKGKGRFYNCNLSKSQYDKCGIGMINLKNGEEVDALLNNALPYLFKKDELLAAKALEGRKTVFRGLLR